jgi:hypothetical protein
VHDHGGVLTFDNRIPYRVAATVVQQMTPTVLLALIDVMSPQELINNLAALKRRGAPDNPELKAMLEQKLESAKTGPRVSAFKAEEALKAADLSPEVRQKLEQVADAQIKAKGKIARPTALFIDKSGSMELAIELGKRLGAMISAICEKDLYVYAFDTMAYAIERGGDDLASWEKALKGITAGGGTSCGVALDFMLRKKHYVEQISSSRTKARTPRPCSSIRCASTGRRSRRIRTSASCARPAPAPSSSCSASKPASRATRSSSRATTTRYQTWCRCCRGRRSWNCGWKSWTTRCPSGSRRSRPKQPGPAAQPQELTYHHAVNVIPKGIGYHALGTCGRPWFILVKQLTTIRQRLRVLSQWSQR